jgi:hypothetical protein
MILSYHDLGDLKRHRVKARVTTDHSASSYGKFYEDGVNGLKREEVS